MHAQARADVAQLKRGRLGHGAFVNAAIDSLYWSEATRGLPRDLDRDATDFLCRWKLSGHLGLKENQDPQ